MTQSLLSVNSYILNPQLEENFLPIEKHIPLCLEISSFKLSLHDLSFIFLIKDKSLLLERSFVFIGSYIEDKGILYISQINLDFYIVIINNKLLFTSETSKYLSEGTEDKSESEAPCSNYADIFKCMSILILFQTACMVSFFNHLWFKTDFFAFYARLVKKYLNQYVYMYLMVDEYFNRPPQDYVYSSYIEYLHAKKSFSKNFLETFILKLASCPLCLSAWVSIVSSLLIGNIFYTGILFILIRAFDSLLNFFLKIH